MIHLLLQYFGGRGSSGKSSGGAFGNSARSGHMFEDKYEESYEDGNITRYEERADMIKQTVPQYSTEQAEELVEHMDLWSGGGYEYVREAQQRVSEGKSYDDGWMSSGELLEDYISRAPKYSGEIYRGINVSEDRADSIINTLASGGSIDMLGTSSWSSKVKVANNFASPIWGNKAIVFRCSKTNKGTSIQHLSGYGKYEAEILVSKTARYRAKSIVDQGSRWYVELEEF